MKYCCKKMEYFVSQSNNGDEFESDHIMLYAKEFDEYGIIVHDSGSSYIKIEYCPWCGKKLPESKRNLWFEELEKLGILNPFEDELPKEFNSDLWWNEDSQNA